METVPQTHGASDLPASNKPSRAEFTYDAAGRTTSVTTTAGTTSLTWDYEDRLVGITYPNTSSNSFSYNAFGARVSKTDSTGTSTYARNGTSVIAPVLSDGSLTFTPGISTNNGSASTYSHGDIKNSLRQTSANESTTATKHFDAFGNVISSSGSWHGPFQYGGPFGYQTDPDSNLKLLGHRYYYSNTGRFLSRDRSKSGLNWYRYAGGSPIGAFDSDGWKKVVIRGDDEGVSYSGLGYWWCKPPIVAACGDIELIQPSRDAVMKHLEDADCFFFWGHGAGGALWLNTEECLTVDDLYIIARRRVAKGKPPMHLAELRACESCSTTEVVNAWLDIAAVVKGYPGVTARPGLIPRIYSPTRYDEKIGQDPSSSPEKGKGKGKTGGWSWWKLGWFG